MSGIEENYSECTQYLDCFETVQSENGSKYICNVIDCSLNYADKSGAIRHLRKSHQNVYNTISKNKKEKNKTKPEVKLIEIRVKVCPNAILNACVDLVTINALPSSTVETVAFKELLKPYIIGLEQKGIKLTINRSVITEEIRLRAAQTKEKIMLVTQNKLICLMIDIATRFNRSIFGINIAYMKDSEVKIHTIGMHVLKKQHTSVYLRDVIKDHLQKYNISLNQLISITSDNGANLIKTIALLDEEHQKNKRAEGCDGGNGSFQNIEFDANEDENFALPENDPDSDEDIDDDIFDESYYNDLLTDVRNQFSALMYSNLIQGISCSAHCLHLIVTQAIDNASETKKILDKCRELAKKLRRPTFRNLIQSKNLKQAKKDINTRWSSIYLMVCITFNK